MAVLRQGDTQQRVRDRDIDRHTMQSKVGHLFSGLWRGKGEEERQRERGRVREGGERGREEEREAASLRGRQKRKLGCKQEGRSACLSGWGRWWAWLVS